VPLSRRRRGVDGGQAVIEGVMMRSPHSYAVAVRQPSGQWQSPAYWTSLRISTVVETAILRGLECWGRRWFWGCAPCVTPRAGAGEPWRRVQNKKAHGIEWLMLQEILLLPGLLHCSLQACAALSATVASIGIFEQTAT